MQHRGDKTDSYSHDPIIKRLNDECPKMRESIFCTGNGEQSEENEVIIQVVSKGCSHLQLKNPDDAKNIPDALKGIVTLDEYQKTMAKLERRLGQYVTAKVQGLICITLSSAMGAFLLEYNDELALLFFVIALLLVYLDRKEVLFMTNDIEALFHEWSERGVHAKFVYDQIGNDGDYYQLHLCVSPLLVFPVEAGNAVFQHEETSGNLSGTHCTVCLDELATYGVYPCGHLCFCDKCYKGPIMRSRASVRRCPVCRRDAQDIIKIYGTF